MDKIKNDIQTINAIIGKWKASPPTGQLQIAIGALGNAVEYATHHINLPPAAPVPVVQPPPATGN